MLLSGLALWDGAALAWLPIFCIWQSEQGHSVLRYGALEELLDLAKSAPG